jgi:RNase P/RNase MRP subunit p30
MIDLIAGNPRIMTADAKPKWTLWNPRQVSNVKKIIPESCQAHLQTIYENR